MILITKTAKEVGAGYKFVCIGHPEGQPRQAGVGFAFRTTLLSHMVSQPHGISPHIMTMLMLAFDRCLDTAVSQQE